MLKRNYICLLFIISFVSTGSALELKQTPIQSQLSNSILLAADNWELDEQKNSSLTPRNLDRKNKSVVKAALYSALLPGLGEHYVGHRTKSKVFFAAEAATWLSYIALHSYGNWKKDDMVRIASDKAGASLEGKDDEFFDWVGFYESSDEFNTLGRVSDPDRPFITPEIGQWQWGSESDRESYRQFKNSSRTAFTRANFMIMVAVGNRIVSIIDAIRDAKRYNGGAAIDISDTKKYNYKFAFNPLSTNRQFSMTLYTPF